MLCPQNGDRIVTIDSVTSLHPMHRPTYECARDLRRESTGAVGRVDGDVEAGSDARSQDVFGTGDAGVIRARAVPVDRLTVGLCQHAARRPQHGRSGHRQHQQQSSHRLIAYSQTRRRQVRHQCRPAAQSPR